MGNTSIQTLNCTKVGFNASCSIPESSLKSFKYLSDVRQYLLDQKFIASDNDSAKWRFLEPVVDEADRGRKDLRIISLQEEKRTHLDDLYQDLQLCPELLLTNTAKGVEDQPDLMGFLVNGFKAGDLTVTCCLRE